MTEFKFSCPQCGQNIQCDTSYSGRQINCPVCQQAIVVPPAPRASGAQPPVKPQTLRKVLVITASVVALAGLVIVGWFGYSKIRIYIKSGHLPSGVVALWSAEGNGKDSIGGNNARIMGHVTFEAGKVGRAFGLDGHSAYLKVPASPALDVGAGKGMTITAWIRPSAFGETPGNGARGPIIEWDSESSDGVQIWANGGNNLSASLKTRTADNRPTSLQSPNGALITAQWQFVALTYDKSSGAAVLYINGVAVDSKNFGRVTPLTSYPINIGRRTGQPIGNGDSFGGLVDKLAIYNRALSAAELRGIYSAAPPDRPVPPPETVVRPQNGSPQPIGWWKLDEGNGTVAKDSSSAENPHEGNLVNGPSWIKTDRGESLQFNGNQYVSLGKILQGSYTEISIACWIKHQRSGWQDVVERGFWGDSDGIGLCMEWQGSSVSFGHYEQAVTSKANVQDDRWHHVVGTLSQSGSDYVYSIYVDGKLDNTSTNTWGLGATSKGWAIGARYDDTWGYRGLINDVRIYDRALSASEIESIYMEKSAVSDMDQKIKE